MALVRGLLTRFDPRRGRRFGAVWGAAAAGLLLVACGDQRLTQNTLDPEGPVARKLDNLINPVFLVAGVVFVLVQGLVLYSAIRFRRRSEDEAPRQVHGNAKMELGWTIAPAVVLLLVSIPTVAVIADINRKPEGADVVNVNVIGHQWWWEFEYPDRGVVTANELHIPAGRPVNLKLTSTDVIHSFWPPKLAGKLDVVPGKVNFMTVEADEPGTYFGQCAEFCGVSHADMRLRVVAHTSDAFDEWVRTNAAPAERPVTGEAAEGATMFRQKGCASCHTVKGFAAGQVGPDLTHLGQRKVFAGATFELNDQNLRLWLRDPPAEKPGSRMPNLELSEDEITKLIAYLDTLE
ncbi:MAG: cytochrome c oxidase subunit II [Actinomycetota bacterium]|nr:cytochrome c oxidase subunit II [Actinomycetota bacterium]